MVSRDLGSVLLRPLSFHNEKEVYNSLQSHISYWVRPMAYSTLLFKMICKGLSQPNFLISFFKLCAENLYKQIMKTTTKFQFLPGIQYALEIVAIFFSYLRKWITSFETIPKSHSKKLPSVGWRHCGISTELYVLVNKATVPIATGQEEKSPMYVATVTVYLLLSLGIKVSQEERGNNWGTIKKNPEGAVAKQWSF